MNRVFFQDGFKFVVLYLKWIKRLNFFKKILEKVLTWEEYPSILVIVTK